MMRTESNHARGTFRQLRIALLGGLTYRLLSLYYQIESIKADLEVCTPVLVVYYHTIVDRGSAGSRQTTA